MEHIQQHKSLEEIRRGPHTYIGGQYISIPPSNESYPKWKYHPSKPAVIVNDAVAEEALGEGWFDNPTDAKAAAEAAEAEAIKATAEAQTTTPSRRSSRQ